MIFYPSNNGLFRYYTNKTALKDYVYVNVSSCNETRDPYTPLDENSPEHSFLTDQKQNQCIIYGNKVHNVEYIIYLYKNFISRF